MLCFISLLLSGHSDQVLSDGFLWEILVIAIIHRSSNVFAKREKCFRKISRYMILKDECIIESDYFRVILYNGELISWQAWF